jgi:hypothetical protein
MFRVTSSRGVAALAALLALPACGTAAEKIEFGREAPDPTDGATIADTAFPDEAPTSDAGVTAPSDTPPVAKCPSGRGGKGNVCIGFTRGAAGPSLNDEARALGLDGHGVVLVGLSKSRSLGDPILVAQTWYPSESAGARKLSLEDLPKYAEPLAVAPGTYYAFAVFRDREPFMREGFEVGDWAPRIATLPQIEVGPGQGVPVVVEIHPVRAVKVAVRLAATPLGSGAGPLRAWLLDSDGKFLGQGGLPCVEFRAGVAPNLSLFTTHTGAFRLAAALFDFAPPVEEAEDWTPPSPGTIHTGVERSKAEVRPGDWVVDAGNLALDEVVPLGAPKPIDPSPSCAVAAAAPRR